MTNRTLILVKPDGVQRLLAGRIIGRFEDRGLKIVGLKLVSSPLVAMVLEGPNAIAVVRAMVGATRPHEAAPGTIRGDFALETAQNLVHASDGAETAASEIALWFAPDELVSYERDIDRWALAPGD